MRRGAKRCKEGTWGILVNKRRSGEIGLVEGVERGSPVIRRSRGVISHYVISPVYMRVSFIRFNFLKESIIFLKNLFDWSIVDLQCCVNFSCTAK